MPRAVALLRNAATHWSNGIRVSWALAALGAVRPAKAPAMAWSEARRVVIGAGDFALTDVLVGVPQYSRGWFCRERSVPQ